MGLIAVILIISGFSILAVLVQQSFAHVGSVMGVDMECALLALSLVSEKLRIQPYRPADRADGLSSSIPDLLTHPTCLSNILPKPRTALVNLTKPARVSTSLTKPVHFCSA